MSLKGQSITDIRTIIAIFIVLLTFYFGYPTVYSVPQGATEVVPLKLIDGQPSYIQLKNSGYVAVWVTVNFSSDGSIHFKNDKGQILDSLEVSYSVDRNDQARFPFTPIFNNSLKNATLIVEYNSNIAFCPILEPRHAKDRWLKVYEKTAMILAVGTQWELRQ